MRGAPTLRQRVLTTACAATGTTERSTRRLGAERFLPALFAQRYANMGGLDPDRFRAEMRGCRSFEDEAWASYWEALALRDLEAAQEAFTGLDGGAAGELVGVLDGRRSEASTVAAIVAPYARLLAEHSLLPPASAVEAYAADASTPPDAADARVVVDAVAGVLRAITYLQVGAFPGGSPARMRAYHRSRRLFDALAAAFTSGLDVSVEHRSITSGADTVHGYLCLPSGAEPSPVVIVTNGLEGTVQELLVPLLRYHARGLGVFVMEMPGSYAYAVPMSPDSEAIYRQVIDDLVREPRIDEARIGIVGVSFGGY